MGRRIVETETGRGLIRPRHGAGLLDDKLRRHGDHAVLPTVDRPVSTGTGSLGCCKVAIASVL